MQKEIFPELERGRPNWDKPHTEVVVYYVKEILAGSPKLNIDEYVLIIAAYAHDWGYSGLFKEGKPLDFDVIENKKVLHAKMGAQKIKLLLEDAFFEFLSKEQKERIIHLVTIHDVLDSLKDADELVLMEADTLGALDVTKVTPGFDKDSNSRYMRGAKAKRYPKFITEYGKKEFSRLYNLREKYYENR